MPRANRIINEINECVVPANGMVGSVDYTMQANYVGII